MKKKKRNVSRHYSDYPPLESYPPLTKKEQEALITPGEQRQERALSMEKRERLRFLKRMKRGRAGYEPEVGIERAEEAVMTLLGRGLVEELSERRMHAVRIARWEKFAARCLKWKKERKGNK